MELSRNEMTEINKSRCVNHVLEMISLQLSMAAYSYSLGIFDFEFYYIGLIYKKLKPYLLVKDC